MKSRVLCNIYIGLWCLYYLQGTLYSQGSIISRISLVFLLLLSFYGFIKISQDKYKPKPLRWLTVLIICWSIYGIFPVLFGMGTVSKAVEPFKYIKDIYISMLPIFTFYWLGRKGALVEKDLRYWYPFFIAVTIALFYHNMYLAFEHMKAGAVGFTVNSGYYVLSTIPLLILFEKKPILQYAMLAVIMYYVLTSFKRGAIIIGAISSLFLLYNGIKNKQVKGKQFKKQLLRIFLSVILVVGVVYAVQHLMMTDDYFVFRLEQTLEGNMSGRDDMYNQYYDFFANQTNIFNYLFGNGAYATLKVFDNYAHNDWLEIAIDNGLIIVLIFAIYWVSLILYFLKNRRVDRTMSSMLALFILIYFIKSFFSMSYDQTPPFASCALGYALAYLENKKRIKYV